ncbi:MAG: diacylglycerol kinase family protein [Bacillota bacterium]
MKRVMLSLKNAFYGLVYCFKTQRNMAVHVFAGVLVLILGVILQVPSSEMLFLLTAIMVVLVAEAVNTAIEKTIDLCTKDRNYLAQVAKDVAAGAVLMTAFFAVIVGLIVLGPPLFRIIKHTLLH